MCSPRVRYACRLLKSILACVVFSVQTFTAGIYWYILTQNIMRRVMTESTSEYFSKNATRHCRSEASKKQRQSKQPVKIKYEETQDLNDMRTKKIKKEENEGDTQNDSSKSCWFPNNWKILLENIKEMRKDRTAVVDSQGCERTADMNEKPEIIRFQTLVSLMLSSQTKDQVTFAAMQRLKEHGLSPDSVMKMSEEAIGKLIYPTGYWKTKANYIKNASRICHEEYNGDIPNTVKGLTSLPGVGPKMAYICMNVAWGKVAGIGVDVHVHRIANRLKWVPKPTKTPEKTRLALEEWLPRVEWKDINVLLVGFGQQTCLPTGPKCTGCLNRDICPSSNTRIKKDPVKKEPRKQDF